MTEGEGRGETASRDWFGPESVVPSPTARDVLYPPFERRWGPSAITAIIRAIWFDVSDPSGT